MNKPLVVSLAAATMLTSGLGDASLQAYAQTPVTIQAGQAAEVTALLLNVRSMPSTKASIIGRLPQYTVITVNGVANGWANIAYNGKTAYVSAQYLQPTAHVAGHKGTVTASLLNVRSMPSINGKIIGGLKKGTAVSISKRLSNGWLQISYNGKAAYVFGKYVTPAAETAAAPVPNASVAVLSAYEQKVVELTNAERIKNGLAALQVDTALSRVARMKSEDMLKNRYFSHNSPTYGSPFNMMRANGITYRSAGENIAMGQRTPEEVVKAWMDSPGHRANILNNTFTHIGVGYVPEQNIWTQQFIGK